MRSRELAQGAIVSVVCRRCSWVNARASKIPRAHRYSSSPFLGFRSLCADFVSRDYERNVVLRLGRWNASVQCDEVLLQSRERKREARRSGEVALGWPQVAERFDHVIRNIDLDAPGRQDVHD